MKQDIVEYLGDKEVSKALQSKLDDIKAADDDDVFITMFGYYIDKVT